MKTCKHRNGNLIEVMDATHVREFINGKLNDIGDNNMEDIRYYVFYCLDCKRKWKFQPNTKIKWLRNIYEQLRNSDNMN